MKIALDQKYLQGGTTSLAGHEIIPFSRDDPRMADFDAFVDRIGPADVLGLLGKSPVPFSRRLVEALPRLQYVHKGGSGLDQYDFAALNEHGILMSNNKSANASCVAEHAVMLILICLRNGYWHMANMRQGIWQTILPQGEGFQILGKTVGIVGLGESGSQIAKRLIAFGARIIAHQRHPRHEPTIFAGVEWVSLHELLRESDIVILCVPLNRETEKMIGARELAMMKPSAVLINVSRGPVVDERALYEALAARRLTAAGLDVFEQEPTPADNPLLKLDNVFATPHSAGRAAEVYGRKIERALENMRRFVAGRRPLGLVNPEILDQGGARAKHLI